MRDRRASYDQYPCQHGICGAHLVCDCLYLVEQELAAEMAHREGHRTKQVAAPGWSLHKDRRNEQGMRALAV
jgi:hypothetical protein